MRTELAGILQSSTEDIATAPWYSEDPTKQDLGDYVRLAAQAIGIDNVVIAAGYPDSAIESIANMLIGQDDAIAAGMSGDNWTYTANFCYDDGNQAEGSPRAERAKIVYAPKPPVRPTGSLAYVFRNCTSLMAIDQDIAVDPQVGWQNVTSLYFAFSGSTILPTTEIRLDIPECTNMGYFGGNFRKITFINCRNVASITQIQYNNTFLQAIEGWNLAQVNDATQPLPSNAAALTEITFDGLTINDNDGSAEWAGGTAYRCDATKVNAVNYIRSGRVLGKAGASGICNIARCANLSAKTLLMLVYMAYDWGTQLDPHNPLNLTRQTNETDALLTYNFTMEQKQKIAAYIATNEWSINPQTIMETKGWTY
jgi:hypothetical protein